MGIFRKTASGDGVLFSLVSPFSGQHIAISEKYWIDIEHRGGIRAASDAEWESAAEIRWLSGTPNLVKLDGPKPEGLITKDIRTVTFNSVQWPSVA